MVDYVFDTEPLLAFLYGEPGHDAVADVLHDVQSGTIDGAIAATNASELFYLIARIEGENGKPTEESKRTADRDVRSLTQRGLTIKPGEWRVAGEVKAAGNISLADAFAVALAHDLDATLLVGADDDFDDLAIDVEIRRLGES